jgi:hypothetical protein
MPNGEGTGPSFRICFHTNEDRRSCGGRPWVYFADTRLCFLTRGAHPQASSRFPFCLDTEAFVSLIPHKWVTPLKQLGNVLGKLSTPAGFETLTGAGSGRLACDVPVRFPEAPGILCRFDFLVTERLDQRNYGLLSPRRRELLHPRNGRSVRPGAWRGADDPSNPETVPARRLVADPVSVSRLSGPCVGPARPPPGVRRLQPADGPRLRGNDRRRRHVLSRRGALLRPFGHIDLEPFPLVLRQLARLPLDRRRQRIDGPPPDPAAHRDYLPAVWREGCP